MYKKIGIIGGLSPESTVSYYLNITRKYLELFGNYNYPEIIIYSVNLQNYLNWRDENNWEKITEELLIISQKLKFAGADFCIIATNTLHKVFNEIQSNIDLKFIHILQPTIFEIKKLGLKTVGLIGTKYVMSENFYKDELLKNNILTLVPNYEQQEIINQIIDKELVAGIIKKESKNILIKIIDELILLGAEGIILGCTEIPLIINSLDFKIPVFDTAVL